MEVWVVTLDGMVDSCWFTKESAFNRADWLHAKSPELGGDIHVVVSCHPANT